jgi:hypothetical protein
MPASVFVVAQTTFSANGTQTFNPPQAIPAGSILIVHSDTGDSLGSQVTTSDTASNVYTTVGGTRLCLNCNALSTSDTITFTLSIPAGGVQKACVALIAVVGAKTKRTQIGATGAGDYYYNATGATFRSGAGSYPYSQTAGTTADLSANGIPTPPGMLFIMLPHTLAKDSAPVTQPTDTPSGSGFTTLLNTLGYSFFGAISNQGAFTLSAAYKQVTGDGNGTVASGTINTTVAGTTTTSWNLFGFVVMPGISNPFALHPPFRGFRGLYSKDGDIKGRSAFTSGPISLGSEFSITGGTNDSEPAVASGTQKGIAERLVLLFTRGTDVYLSHSDGDGEPGTWNTPTLMFSGCKHPDISYDRTSKTWFYLARETSTGHLLGSIQGPGDTPLPAFTLTNDSGSPLVVDDDTARVAPAEDGPRRWRLAAMISGAYTVWKCTDDGSSWKQEI